MDESSLPIEYDPSTGQPLSLPVDSEVNPAIAKLFGIGQERYQTWPERMIRSGATLPGDVATGKLPIMDPETGHTSQTVIERAQDLAGMAGGGALLEKPGVASVGSGPIRQAPKASELAPPFYSTLERAVEQAKPSTATADQWLGYLKNQPGVKTEELATVLKELPKGQISKPELEGIVKQNKVELGEVVKGDLKKLPEGSKIHKTEGGKNFSGQIMPDTYHVELPDGTTNRAIWKSPEAAIENMINHFPKTKFHQYQLPGGENYKEMLLTLPDKRAAGPKTFDEFAKLNNLKDGPEARSAYFEFNTNNKNVNDGGNFKSSHWDEPNVLAHIRMNDRYVGGNKILHLEEIQSDWHQKGRKEGYKLSENQKQELNNIDEILTSKLDEKDIGNPDIDTVLKTAVDKKVITEQEAKNYKEYSKGENSNVPDAPFKKSWDELALKKVIRHAAENGYEGVSWTPGEAQAARYDLSKQVKSIHWDKSIADKNSTLVEIHPNGGNVLKLQVDGKGNVQSSFPSSQGQQFEGKNLSDVIGKEHAEKILNKSNGSLEGDEIKIGGEGMKSFYDKMLVDKANAIGKKYGSKVEQKFIIKPETKLSYEELQRRRAGEQPDKSKFEQPIHYLPLTPELKKKALQEGFSLFSSSPVLVPVNHDPFKRKYKLTPIQGNPFVQN